MSARRLAHRWLALARSRRLDRELNEEVRAHLELAERDALAAGLSPEEARLEARRRFGGIDQVKELHRDHRSVRPVETLLTDVRYGLALLRRAPGFTAIAVGVLALGIGATAAMFSLLDAVLVKPLPFPDPDRIVRVWEAPRQGATNATAAPDFLDWQRLGTAFEALAAEDSISLTLTGTGEPTRLPGKAVTADYFAVFGTKPRLGRAFTRDDERRADPAIVLSHAAWQTYFGGDPGIVQRHPILDGMPHRIVGVLPPGAFDRDPARFWKLLVFTPEQRQVRENHWLTVHGRLRSTVTLAQAREQMRAIRAGMLDVMSAFKREWTIVVEPFDTLLVGDDLRRSIVLGFGSAAFVLLIACANVTNLLIGKGVARRKELAVRAALGAGRGRLVAQLLTEALMLGLLGGAAGVATAYLLIGAATPALAASIPSTADVTLDGRVLAFVAAVALGVTFLVGTLPALQTTSGDLVSSLNQASRGASGAHGRLRHLLVIGEVALSLVLLCAALLLFKTLFNLQRLDTGVRIEHVMSLSLDLPRGQYPTAERAATFYESLTERLQALPGVQRAAVSTQLPLEWIMNGEGLWVGGSEAVNVRLKRVDAGYFGAFDIPVVAGRGLTRADRADAPGVIVINEALARRLSEMAGVEQPVGQSATLSSVDYDGVQPVKLPVEIVGVIRSERVGAPWRPDPPVVYAPMSQVPRLTVKLIVRSAAAPAAVVPAVREVIRQLDPNLPVGDVSTMQQIQRQTLSTASRPAWLMGAFATVAVLLAALGLYGVLAHAVTQQRREIGIRMALGARSRDVLSQVLGSALTLIGVGLALGLAGAIALTRVMKSLLYQVSPVDPGALAVACAALMAIGVLAGLVPARRATAVDPVSVLRDEG